MWTNNIQCATALTVKQQQVSESLLCVCLANLSQSATFQALWKGKNVNFIVDYNDGLSIKRSDNKVSVYIYDNKMKDGSCFTIDIRFYGAIGPI